VELTCGFKAPAVATVKATGESLDTGVITIVGSAVPIVQLMARVIPSATVTVAAGFETCRVTGTARSKSPETLKWTLAV
jgi:hypothetical protein